MNSTSRPRAATKPLGRRRGTINFATCYVLDDDAYRAFSDVLDHPPPATEELRKLMEAKAPWRK